MATKKEKQTEKKPEIKAAKAPETIQDRIKKAETFRLKKKELREKTMATRELDEQMQAIIEEEHAWLKSIAEPVPQILKKKGFWYELVKRGEKTLIFSQKYPDDKDREKPGSLVGYEVFLLKISPPREYRGAFYEANEAFPGSNESFGRWAWAYGIAGEPSGKRAWEAALERFNKLEGAITEDSVAEEEEEEEEIETGENEE